MTDDELLEKGEEIIRAIRVAREALRGERVKLREDVAAMREEMREAREEEMRGARGARAPVPAGRWRRGDRDEESSLQ